MTIVCGIGPDGNIVKTNIAEPTDAQKAAATARAAKLADMRRAADPRDTLLDLVVSRLLDAGTLEADAVVATGAPVSSVVSEKLQLFAKSQPAKVE